MPHVNDVHSQLKATLVKDIRRPDSLDALRRTVAESAKTGEPLSICGPSSDWHRRLLRTL